MEVRIDKIKPDIKGKDISLFISHSSNMWTGLPLMSEKDLLDLRKAIRKYIINSKRKSK